MNKIQFNYADSHPLIFQKKQKKFFLESIFNSENFDLDKLLYIFCSDKYLLKINRQFLHHNTYTDIITFSLSEKSKPFNAEIYVSIPRVKENAKHFKIKYEIELMRVMIHGILHLCGYDDKTEKQKKKIRQKENEYLENFYKVPREI